jgi:prepilin-type N-terminal cleavage/methylation domain-containing protein
MPPKMSQGFTLIELSIVLVIIGLIVGGVLVGRDLIEAATIRSEISQIERYNTAVNTFRIKYNALPGDMLPANASAFGFAVGTGGPGLGDGNGLIGVGGGGNGTAFMGGEACLFWVHLSSANHLHQRQCRLYGAGSVPPCWKPGSK